MKTEKSAGKIFNAEMTAQYLQIAQNGDVEAFKALFNKYEKELIDYIRPLEKQLSDSGYSNDGITKALKSYGIDVRYIPRLLALSDFLLSPIQPQSNDKLTDEANR